MKRLYIYLFLGICGELVPRSPAVSKTKDAQVPYIKWHYICMGPIHILLCTLNHLWIAYNT